MRARSFRPCLAAPLLLAAGACASPGPGASFDERDPYRETNESIHAFNVALDRNVLRPVAQGYGYATPTLVKFLLGNAFNHIDTVNDFANHLLQGEFEPAGTALGRFTVNTVLGAGGLLDPATEFGLPKEDTDFGVTLGTYGAEEGAYLVLPLFGPSTTRDLGGFVGDMALDPFTYTGFSGSNFFNAFNPALSVGEVIHQRDANAAIIDDLLYESENSYVSLRAVYLQRRDALIQDPEDVEESLPDIFDDEASD